MKGDSEVKFGVSGIFLLIKRLSANGENSCLIRKIWSEIAVYIIKIHKITTIRLKENKSLKIYRGARSLLVSLFALCVMIQGEIFGQTTMARFQLNGNLNVSNDNATGIPSATNSGLTFSTNNECEGTGHLYADDPSQYLDILINTSGYRNITFSFQQRLYNGGSGTNLWSFYGDYNNDGSNDYSVTNSAVPTTSCGTVNLSLPTTFDNQNSVRFRIQFSGSGSRTIYLDDIYIRGLAIPQYLSEYTSMDIGSATWCPGETRTITVKVKNIGQATWTDAGPDVNIGVKWNGDPDYLVRTDAGGLAPGATRTYSLTVTAPSAGTNNLTFDVVNEGNCWFGNNNGSCGPGNTVFTSSALTILNSAPAQPSTITGSATPCPESSQTYSVTNIAGLTYTWSFPTGWTQTGGGTTNSATVTVGITSGTVQVTPSNSCSNGTPQTLNATINQPKATVTNQKNISCYGGEDGSLTIQASGGTAPYQYSVDNGENYTPGTNPNPHLYTGLRANIPYKIRVKDNLGCTSTAIP